MSTSSDRSVWESGNAYEPYIGRWSRLVAREFVDRLTIAPSARWLDVGCGTGALTQTILHHANPRRVHGIDPSEGYLAVARQQSKIRELDSTSPTRATFLRIWQATTSPSPRWC